MKTVRTEETVEAVRLYVENNARNVSCRRTITPAADISSIIFTWIKTQYF